MNHTQLINKICKEAIAYAREQGWVDSKWNCAVKIDTSPRRSRSWGGQRYGKPFVSLAIRPHLNGVLTEYSSFKNDPEIGTVSGSVEKALAALTVHELAHAMQYSGNKTAMAGNSVEAKRDTHGHGALWRKIYRALRVNIVNNKQWAPYQKDDKTTIKMILASTCPSRAEARQIALRMFREGNKAGDIIRHLIGRNMKKTTASTYVYEVKSLFSY